ncbi:MAG: amidohydrolase family protein [Thermonemataceae bacterium]
MKYLVIILLTLLTPLVQAQSISPAPQQSQPIIIENATIHVGNGQVIEKGVLVFQEGKITTVGTQSDDLTNAKRIDAQGKHVYPGLILPSTTLGLREVDAVRATLDYREVGKFNPHVRSLIAFNTDSDIIPTIRHNGVLIAQPAPRGNMITGTSAVVRLDAWNWEDAAIKAEDGIHLNWVSFFKFDFATFEMVKNKERDQDINALGNFFAEAQAYFNTATPSTKNLKYEAMKGLFTGDKNLYIHVDYGREIVEAVQFVKKYGVKKIVVIGGRDAWMLTDFLKENDIPIILNRIHALPDHPDYDVKLPFKMPNILHKAGIKVALNYEGDMEAMGSRNLPFIAGTAITYGLPKEEALKMVTANTAEILGIDQMYGTLEQGKSATLIVSDGDLFDMRTSQIVHAFIDGKEINLDNRQKQLYEKYKAKYENE